MDNCIVRLILLPLAMLGTVRLARCRHRVHRNLEAARLVIVPLRVALLETVLTSVGKSRAVVNRFTAAVRVGGSATVVLQLTFSAIVIASASPNDRERITAREVGGLGGATAGSWGGAWAGCAALAALTSPSLVLPIVGEVTEGGACLVGGIAGGFGAGWIGSLLGQWAGEATYDFATDLLWAPQ